MAGKKALIKLPGETWKELGQRNFINRFGKALAKILGGWFKSGLGH